MKHWNAIRYRKKAQHAVAHISAFPRKQSALSIVLAGNKIASGET